MFPEARLSDCRDGGAAEVAVLEPEEAVCAIREAGSLTGRVGDFGLGFTKPVCGGEGCILVLGAEPFAAVVGRLLAVFEAEFGANEDLLGFLSDFLSGDFAGATLV